MPRSLFKVAWRYLLAHPLQSALMVLGIALGVAVAVSVDVANVSAKRGFELSTEAVVGRATHYLSGGPSGLDEALYADLKSAGLGLPMAPVLSQYTNSPELGGIPVQLLGVDPFAEQPFRSYLGDPEAGSGASELMGAFFTQPGALLISSQLAAEYGLQAGDTIHLNINGQSLPAQIAGLIEARDALSARGLETLLLADIATVQEFNGQIGRLERIDLILSEEGEAEDMAAMEELLPPGVEVLTVEGRSTAVEQMTAAFSTNLTALSLLALTVGLFLIYNTMTFSVIQRRRAFGTLRALGTTSREIFTLVLVEALLVGLVGSALGLGLGVLLGRGAVDLVSQTINDSFFTLTVREVGLPNSSLVKGALLGMLATLLATLMPAYEAAHAPPRRTLSRAQLESVSNRLLRWAALGGALLAVGSGLLLALVRLNLVASFAATFGVVIGFAMLAPWATYVLMPPAARLLGRLIGPIGRLAPREVSSAASRTSVAMAALMVAVAVTIGVSLMVGSFRSSVIVWLNQILSSDIYVTVAGASLAEPMVAIQPEIFSIAEELPGVEALYSLRNVEVDSPFGPVTVAANDNPGDGEEQIYVERAGSAGEVWEQVQNGAVMLSEPLANRLELGIDETITLYTNQGPREFSIAAVYVDYTSSRGNAIMWLEVYRQNWDDPEVTAFSIVASEGQDTDALVDDLRQALLPIQNLNIRSNQGLRTETLEVFDRTFTITGALQVITTAVAFVGVLSAMLSLQLEKQRQLGIMKAIGLSARQLWALVILETGLIGAVAGLLALPTGYAVSVILVELINKRSFGWSLQMDLQAAPFAQALAIAILAALLAGIYPAFRMSRRRASDAMRFD